MTVAQTTARPLWHFFMPPCSWCCGERLRRYQARHPFRRALHLSACLSLRHRDGADGRAGAATGALARTWRLTGHIAVVGLFLQAIYLGGVYTAIARGIPAGISALIVGVQPIIIAAVVGPLLGERVRVRQWLGLVLGFLGIGLVLWNKLSLEIGQLEGVAWNVVGLIGITVATLYQKKYCSQMDWRSGGVIQYGAAAAATYAMTLIMGESGAIVWSRDIVIAYAWLILVLSIGAVSLLGWLIRRGEASRVAGMFYLVPPTAALGGWVLFGETLGSLALLGMAVTVVGVALVARR
jgi:drug/metabolite transporter (DMT)-like permease